MMLHTFLADDVARAKIEEATRRAERTAELARSDIESKRGLRVAVGRRLVRTGLRLSGTDIAAFTQSAPQADPCL